MTIRSIEKPAADFHQGSIFGSQVLKQGFPRSRSFVEVCHEGLECEEGLDSTVRAETLGALQQQPNFIEKMVTRGMPGFIINLSDSMV